MAAFTLDTSGAVGPVPGYPNSGPVEHGCKFIWRDLTPFQQGYVEALFTTSQHIAPNGQRVTATNTATGVARPVMLAEAFGFRDLSSEAVALILRDCEAALRDAACGYSNTVEFGAMFWKDRQQNQLNGMEPKFPPLTPYLNDEGKVALKVAA